METTKRQLNAQSREYESGIEHKKGVENGQLALWELEVGDVVRVLAGEEEERRYTYEFEVRSAGEEPTVVVKQTGPDGTVVYIKDFEVTLRGSGSWVGREWPMHEYGRGRGSDGKQILIQFGHLQVGGEIVLFDYSMPFEHRMAVMQPAIHSIEIINKSSVDQDIELP